MTERKKPVNPFYVLLVIVGIAFLLTSSGYWMMSLRSLAESMEPVDKLPPHPLLQFMKASGEWLLFAELGLLGLLTLGAIGLDSRRARRAVSKPGSQAPEDSAGK